MEKTGIAEIDHLVQQYNRTQLLQTARLQRLHKLIKNRQGYREVRIGHTDLLWGPNDWQGDDRLDTRFTDRGHPPITGIIPGAERPEPRPPDEVPFVKGLRAETDPHISHGRR